MSSSLPNKSLLSLDLRCEYLIDPLGIDTATPRFSWKLQDKTGTRGQKQTGYHLLVAGSRDALEKNQGDLWDSGVIASSQSTLLPYGGSPLSSNQDCYWKVQVLDMNGQPGAWSPCARFSIGLLQPEDWTGPWIQHPSTGIASEKHLWFRKNFTLEKPLHSAFLHIASLGYHELYLNGKKADDRLLAPAQTRLDKRVLSVTYDVSGLLQAGKNSIAIWYGPGWSRYEFFNMPQTLRVQLNAAAHDGNAFALASDSSWRCEVSNSENTGLTKFENNGGEKIDATKCLPGWNKADFNDSRWSLVEETSAAVTISPQMVEPTRIIETIPAQSVSKSGQAYKVDLGKNFSGWLEIKMGGQAFGDAVTIKVSDDPSTDQNFAQRCEYICSGKSGETFRNRFNYVAGRYIHLEGLRESPKKEDIIGLALATDMKQTGSFSCSRDLFNRIYETDLWTYLTNTVEGFTSDCPHRERLGYGEVAFATSWGISLPNFDAGAFSKKQLGDWIDVQMENGWFHHTAPQINEHYGGPMWSSAGLNISWEFYLTYGDKKFLEAIYAPSKKWFEFLLTHVKDGLLQNYSDHWGKFLGDWAAPGQRNERGDSPEAQFFNNCVYVMNLANFVETARILGKTDDVTLYSERLEKLKQKVQKEFYNPATGRYCLGTQVQLAFALLLGITPENLRATAIANLKKDMSQGQAYLDMGSSGLPVLFKYLIENSECAEPLSKLLSSTVEPSYGYFLARGETAWPEYWNVDVPSRMHTCYTGVASWFIKGLGGIQADTEKPGYQSFVIKPAIVSDLKFAEARVESSYGLIESRWEKSKNKLKLKISIPPNSQATVYLPPCVAESVSESGGSLASAKGITVSRSEGQNVVLQVESGVYEFDLELI